MTATYKVVSLFSGAMGLDLGLEQTGRFNVLACIEKEPAYCQTIRANQERGLLRKDIKIFECDIERFSPHEFLKKMEIEPEQIDLLVGGPPCQSFSTAGRRGTVQDPRGSLLWQYLKWIEVLKPKFFLMENVRGLLSAALRHRALAERPNKGGAPLEWDELPGSVVRSFAEDLQRKTAGRYHMDCFEVNAVNYGAPQLRERAFFIGNRFNSVLDFPEPTHGNPNSIDSLFDQKLLPWRTLGDAIREIKDDDPTLMDFSPRKKTFLTKVPPGSNWRSLSINDQQDSMGRAWHAKGGRSGWWRRLSYDLPCPTLMTMPNHASTSLCHPEKVRALTLREYACVQEFPLNWHFSGTPSEQYAQVGNAVPVRLGHVAGELIAKELDNLASRNWQSHSRDNQDYRVVYVQAHIRTRQWFKAGKTFIWSDDDNNESAAYVPPVTRKKVSRIG